MFPGHGQMGKFLFPSFFPRDRTGAGFWGPCAIMLHIPLRRLTTGARIYFSRLAGMSKDLLSAKMINERHDLAFTSTRFHMTLFAAIQLQGLRGPHCTPEPEHEALPT